MWNCINNEVTGFVDEDLKTNDLLKNILDIKYGKKVDENKYPCMQTSEDSSQQEV